MRVPCPGGAGKRGDVPGCVNLDRMRRRAPGCAKFLSDVGGSQAYHLLSLNVPANYSVCELQNDVLSKLIFFLSIGVYP